MTDESRDQPDQLRRIETVCFEDPPWQYTHTEDALLDDYLVGLPELFLARLDEIHRDVDATRCWECGWTVGFYLYGDNDNQVGWRTVELARQDGGPVVVLCEGCGPYDYSLSKEPK